MKKKIKFFSVILLFCTIDFFAQDCNSLFLINAENGNIYNISTLNGTLPSPIYNATSGESNLAVGPNPTNLSQTVFTHSNTESGASIFVNNANIGTTQPVSLGGLTTNPSSLGTNAGYVYGISSSKQLIKVSPSPSQTIGAISGDTIWSNGTVSNDAFFDNVGRMYTVITNGGSKYLYRIDISTLQATQYLGLSGSLPSNVQGLSFFNNNIYAIEGYTSTILFISWFNVRVYEINSNTGVGVVKTSYQLNTYLGPFSGTDNLDLASCQYFVPTTAPTCNELFGVVGSTQTAYKIELDNALNTIQVADGNQTNQGNLAFGPIVGNLNQNQFVTSTNNLLGTIYSGTATTAFTNLNSTTSTWGTPIGLGTDPSTGYIYGINNNVLTRWIGSGNATTLGTVTGDTNWTSGISLNDIAVDNGGNLYCIKNNGLSNVWLYRINPNTLQASPVVRVQGTYPTDLNTNNGNGLAYLGGYFYYSRINGVNTDLWRLDAMTGQSSYVGSIANRNVGDLASCATVTNVPSSFTFNCSAADAGIQGNVLVANGTTQNSVLRIPITNAVNGQALITVSGSGLFTSPSPYPVFVTQGATYIDVPVTYNGTESGGSVSITVGSAQATGSCSITVFIDKDTDKDGIRDGIDLDDDNDGITDEVECGYCSAGSDLFGNGGFEQPVLTTDYTQTNSVPNWSTTASDNLIELWRTGFLGFASAEGNQFAELNANQASTLYQNFCIPKGGATLNWSLKHRGRSSNTVPDVAQVRLGTSLSSYTVVATMSDSNTAWGSYSGSINLPANNAGSYFMMFSAISSAGGITQGNFLDDIKITFTPICHDTDGDGTPNSLDLDSDSDGCYDSLEGDENVNASMLNADGSINSTVDSNGIPVIVNSGGSADIGGDVGQGNGTTQNANIYSCPDYDGDGITDLKDLDDDNDGILDLNENSTCTASSVLSLYGWSARVFDAPAGTDAYTEISNSIIFPSISYSQLATFSYDEFKRTKDAFDINFNGAVGASNTKVTNYQGTLIAFGGNEDFAVLFTKYITTEEAGTYQFDLTYADDHAFAYKNGVKVAQQQNGYAGGPFNNFVTLSLIPGDTVSFLMVEDAFINTTISVNATKTSGTCMNDTDGDGILDFQDLDSDNDGCPDAIEGSASILNSQLVNSSIPGGNNTATSGTFFSPINKNLCSSASCVSTSGSNIGLPQLATPTDYSNTLGQTLGSSQNASINSCYCYKPAQTTGTTLDTNHGITALGRAGADNGNWPMVRKGAWTILEAKTKGFVVNRLTDAQIAAIPAVDLREGMMVYNITQDCLQINIDGAATGWKCFNTQTCPD